MDSIKQEPVTKLEFSEEGLSAATTAPLQPVKKEEELEHGGLTDVRLPKDEASQCKAEPKKEKDSDDEKLSDQDVDMEDEDQGAV
eukprot:2005642-Amphidinium_carterae.1